MVKQQTMNEIIFNTNLANKLINKIPRKISSLGLYFSNEKEVTGYIRFYRDSLIAIYLIVIQKNKIEKYKRACILKYEFIDDDFVFTDIYLRTRNPENMEYRYNKDMELNSEYIWKEDLSGVCKTVKNKKLIKYIWPNPQKEFKEQMKYLKEKDIIIINKKNPKRYQKTWFRKEPGGDIYLVLDQ